VRVYSGLTIFSIYLNIDTRYTYNAEDDDVSYGDVMIESAPMSRINVYTRGNLRMEFFYLRRRNLSAQLRWQRVAFPFVLLSKILPKHMVAF
jgi:hypothetical protein